MTTDTTNKDRLDNVSKLDRLDQCDDCGSFYVSSANHTCGRPWSHLTKDPNHRSIAIMVEHDDNDPDEHVVFTNSRWSRAYHKSNDDPDNPHPVDSRCVNAKRSDDTEWQRDTRDNAQDDWLFPCTRCHDLSLKEIHEELEARKAAEGDQ